MPDPKTDEPRGEMLYGALDMLILKALQLERCTDGVTERIRQWSDEVLEVNQLPLSVAVPPQARRDRSRPPGR